MKMKVLSHYDGDMEKRFGDCILIYDSRNVIVYDCGHARHAEEVEKFLESRNENENVYIVISHNDSDHVDGIDTLLEYLAENDFSVTVYTSLYLKSTKKVMEILDDDRRTPKKTREKILGLFDRIAEIVDNANDLGFDVENAIIDTAICDTEIVGSTEDEFAQVVAEAIKTDGEGDIAGETVMNAASIQLKCELDNEGSILLCGDAAPGFLHNLDEYEYIQLSHHGNYDNGLAIFDALDEIGGDNDSYCKKYII